MEINRKNRIAIPAFPHLRILPGRGEGRPVARTKEQGAVYEEREGILIVNHVNF